MDEQRVAEFVSITSAPRGAALRYLDAAGGDLQEAIEKFFADGSKQTSTKEPAASRPANNQTSRRQPGRGGVRGLSDLNAPEEDEGDDDYNDYYAGGEKSGQLVRGAPKEGDRVEDVFQRAREAGAVEGRPVDLHHRGDDDRFQAFSGRSRMLSGVEVEATPTQSVQATEQTRTIAFYRDGVFTVDDGEPRRMDDPSNLSFMSAITRGQLPSELDPGDPSIHVTVNLIRRDEEYTPPAQPRFKAFTGSGRTLADTAPAPVDSTAAASNAAASQSVGWEGADRSKPTTSIQLRLADGSRIVAEFNLDHTVQDIRRFIGALRPDMGPGYTLTTAFPPRQLADGSATIEAAGLANSVVIQKL